jgi:glycosyltransferase involved in cell wall biosynthesis
MGLSMPALPYPMEKVPVSVVVLTRDEEANITACLRSIGWAGEIFLVDSGSKDRTVETVQAFGAKVYEHSFEGYAKQRNWALRNLPISSDWVLMLDADERIPPALAEEIQQAIRNGGQDFAGFYLKFRHIFLGRSLQHGGLYPTWLLRLYKRHRVRFEDRPMNEHVILEGKAGYLSQPFEHRDLRPLRHWVSKHNRYAELEAEEYFQEKFGGGCRDAIPARFWGSQAERKRWIKLRVWNRLPVLMRPFLLFFRNYFLKAGFLDGRAGFIYHVLWSFWYPFLVGVKIVERQVSSESPGLNRSQTSNESEHDELGPIPEGMGLAQPAGR